MTTSLIASYFAGASSLAWQTSIRYGAFGQHPTPSATENSRDIEWSEAGIFHDMVAYINANTAADSGTCTLRINSTDSSVSVSVGAGVTGEFNDSVNKVSIADGDSVKWKLSAVAVVDSITGPGASVEFTPDNGVISVQHISAGLGSSFTTASVTRWPKICTNNNQGTVENAAEVRTLTPSTCKYFHVRVTANTRTETTAGVRINNADSSLVVSITASTTGVFQNLSDEPSLAVDDEFALFFRTGTGTNGITLQTLSFQLRSTSGAYDLHSGGPSASTTTTASETRRSGLMTHGTLTTSAAAESVLKFDHSTVLSLMSIYTHQNGRSTDTTVSVADETGTDTGPSISITAATTGEFQDPTTKDSVYPGDYRCYNHTTGSGTGTVGEHQWSILSTPTAKLFNIRVIDVAVIRSSVF